MHGFDLFPVRRDEPCDADLKIVSPNAALQHVKIQGHQRVHNVLS
jgi:hypothetical protein